MTTMVAEVYDALKDAGASEENARRAAQAITANDARLDGVEGRLGRIEGRLTLLTWQIGAVGGALILIGLPSLWLLVRLAAKAGSL